MEDEFSFEQFGSEGKKTSKDSKAASLPNFSSETIQISRRVKVLEDSLGNLRKKMLVDEQNDMNRHKKELSDYRSLLSEINEIKKDIENIKRVAKEIISELKSCARHEEVDVLKKYINLWDPIKFVTEETVERMIDEKMGKEEQI
jgi:hypothetical protein